MTEEYNALMDNNTWQLVLHPPNANIIGCRWVYKVKQRQMVQLNALKLIWWRKDTLNNMD